MPWYAAHAIMYFKLKSHIQDCFTVWENVYLIEAPNSDEALVKAEVWAKEHEGDDDNSLRIGGQPATLVFAGIRKLITVSHWDKEGQLCSQDEVTYSEFQVPDEETVLRLGKGEEVTIDYIE
ncbi:MAG: DUF4288 domain-containing protein [Acidobacteria bacterium]|nr:DUF4288 domain-containing protein [Acidobacteriota bacterium]